MVTATHQLCQKKTCKFINKLIVHFYFQVLLQQRINTNKQQQPLLKSPNHIHCLHSVPHVCLSSFLFYPLLFFPLLFFPSGFFRLPCGWNLWWAGLADANTWSLTRKIPSASTNAKYIVSRKGISLTPNIKIWRKQQSTVDRERAISAIVTATHQLCRTHVSSSLNWLHTFTFRCSCNKESTQTSNNNLFWKARTIFTAYTVSHMFASLRSCSILSCSFLSSSFLRASSAYHAVEIYGEQDWLMRTRDHWLERFQVPPQMQSI